jgi:hypothetical protein
MRGSIRNSKEIVPQISPVRIRRADQVDFPVASPLLQLLFTRDRALHVVAALEPDESMQSILARKAGDRVIPMLPYTPDEIRRDTDIQSAHVVVRHDVHSRLPFHGETLAHIPDCGSARTAEFIEIWVERSGWIPAFARMTVRIKRLPPYGHAG